MKFIKCAGYAKCYFKLAWTELSVHGKMKKWTKPTEATRTDFPKNTVKCFQYFCKSVIILFKLGIFLNNHESLGKKTPLPTTTIASESVIKKNPSSDKTLCGKIKYKRKCFKRWYITLGKSEGSPGLLVQRWLTPHQLGHLSINHISI